VKPPRHINPVDRLLAHEDGIKRAIGETKKARRRTVRRFGRLEIVIVEESGEPTKVYLTNDADISGSVVEATAGELALAATAVRELLADPPPIKRRPRG
jgi:hypothetical protein